MAHRTQSRVPSPAEPLAGAATAARWVGRLPAVAGWATALLGMAAVEAYIFGVGPLISAKPFLPQIVPLTALMFVLTGGSLLSLKANLPRHQLAAAGFTILIAALVLAEYLIWRNLGLDTLIFPDDVHLLRSAFPGRPAPSSTACFLLLGLALVLTRDGWHLEHRRPHLSALMAAAVLPLVAIVGHVFGVPELYAFAPGVGTSLVAALLLLLLTIGVAAATHESAMVELLVGQDPGTILLRRLLPLAVMIPLLFAAGSLLALRLGPYQKHVVLALFVGVFIGLSLAAAFWVAAVVRRADIEGRAAEWAEADMALSERLLQAEQATGAALRESVRQTRELLEILNHAPVLARGLDGTIQFWSAGAQRLYGWDEKQAVGADALKLLHTELPVPADEAVAALLEKGEWHAELSRRSRY